MASRKSGSSALEALEALRGAKATKGGNWCKPGIYKAEITAVKLEPSRSSGLGFIVEFKCLEAEPKEDRTPHSVNEQFSWGAFNGGNGKDSWAGNVKAFALAALGVDETDADEDEDGFIESVADMCAEDQPLVGTVVHIDAYNIITRAGNDFTKVIFTHIDDVEEAAA